MTRLTGERKAVAAAMLALYGFLFLLVTLQSPPGWEKVFGGLALIYWTGFFGVVSGYFWARWFATGLGLSGLMSAGVSIFQMGPEPVLVFYGVTHALIAGMLWGNHVAKSFDGRIEWRKRFHLDDQATDKLGKAVTRVGMSLPYVIMYALAPKEGSAALFAYLGLGCALAGAAALVRQKTWALLSLGAAALFAGAYSLSALGSSAAASWAELSSHVNSAVSPWLMITGPGDLLVSGVPTVALVAGALLLGSVLPFAGPLWRAIRSAESLRS